MIKFVNEKPEVNDFMNLFETTGWNQISRLSKCDFQTVIDNSWLFICAYDEEKLVGCGRLLTDHAAHAMIFDLITHPDYQNRGIAGKILDDLVSVCKKENIRDIQLFCARGKRSFYEKRGFRPRPEDAPGMEYKQS